MFKLAPMNKDRDTATGLALFVLLIGLSFFPQFDFFTIWLFPVPIIVVSVLQPEIYAFVMSVIAGLVLAFSGLGWFAVFLILALYFLAWTVRENILHERSIFLTVVTVTLVFIMLELIMLALFRWNGINFMEVLKTQLSASYVQDKALIERAGSTTGDMINQTMSWIQMMFPALLSVMALGAAVVNARLLTWLLRRKFSMSPILRNWRLPYSSLLVYLLSLVLILLHAFQTVPWLWQSLHNLEFLCSFLIAIQGISFLWRRFLHYTGRWFILVLLVAVAIFPLVSMIYVVIGVMDILNETRKRQSIKK